jgi:hypothetical protein
MPVPPVFENRVRLVASPGAVSLNAEINAQAAESFWVSSIQFTQDLGTAILLFTKTVTSDAGYPYLVPQKVNLVDLDQTAINDDIAAEATDHNWPTGIFAYGDLGVFILYSGLTSGGGE